MTVPWSPAEPAGHRPSRVAVADVHYLPGDRARAAVVVYHDAQLADALARGRPGGPSLGPGSPLR